MGSLGNDLPRGHAALCPPYPLRSELGRDFNIVTPGIRPGGDLLNSGDDQNRVMTPGMAITAGADYLVVGRPISLAGDPVAVIAAMQAEITAAVV